MLYFAYGSNMDWNQMWERCPSARFVGMALLPDHKLGFTRKSQRQNCGVADAVAIAGRNLWGAYEIDELDVGSLDASEGYRPGQKTNSCRPRERMALRDGDESRPRTVWTYFVQPEANPPLASAKYVNLVISGARHWRLPEDYIRDLERIELGR